MMKALAKRIRALLTRAESESQLDEELRFHLEKETEQNIARGMGPREARRRALVEFGAAERFREECRDARGVRPLEDFWQDVRYGLRVLARRPGFTLVAVATLALGIGATTAIFSVVNGVLLRPLDFPEADRLVALSETSKEVPVMSVAYPNYLDWRASQTVFESMAARMPAGGVLAGDGGEPLRIMGRYVTASFFPVLGVRPHAGRFFTGEEDRPGAERVMVISHSLWQRRFGGDERAVGRAVRYNGESWTVVGVLPASFDFYGRNNLNNDFLIPLGRLGDAGYMRDRSSHPVLVTARLRPGVGLEQAVAEMEAITSRLSEQYPESNEGNGVVVRPFLDDYVGDVRPALLMLTVAVAILLLIACANVANLLLARATTRRREIAMRMALGAGRARVVRQLLTESVLLAAAGGAAGLLLSAWGVGALIRLYPNALPRLEDLSPDARAYGFAVAVTLLTGVAFGLAPALQTSKVDLHDALKEGGLRATGGAGGRLRSAFVVAQVALSLVLLVGAGLLVKSFRRLTEVDPGFDARGVLTLRLRLPDAKYREAAQSVAFLREVTRRVRALPGVAGVSVASGFPLGRVSEDGYWLEGRPEPRLPGEWPVADVLSVDENYHRALGVALLAGRGFTDRDAADSPPVVLVDEDFVRRHFPDAPPDTALGRRVRFGGEGEPWREIVGVARHVRHGGLAEAGHPGIYRPWTQADPRWLAEYSRAMDLVVKTQGEPLSFVAAIRREAQAVDAEQPLGNVRALEDMLAQSLAPRRFTLLLVGVFAAAALLLGAVGLYGVLSYAVTQRTREIGVRMALGARGGDIARLVIGHGLALALTGVALGLGAALAATRLMSGMLFGVSATDPPTFALVALLLLAVALLACYVPARRATKVDPVIALRAE